MKINELHYLFFNFIRNNIATLQKLVYNGIIYTTSKLQTQIFDGKIFDAHIVK